MVACGKLNAPMQFRSPLMNGEKLVELLAEYQVGIKRQTHDLFESEEEDESEA